MTIRRSAVAAAGMLAAGLVLAGCGEEKAAGTAARTATVPPSPVGSADAGCAAAAAASSAPAEQPTVTGDDASKYLENHAFQSTVRLKGAALCTAARQEERVKGALARFAGRDDVTQGQVRAALTRLGYATGKVSTSGDGAIVTYIVDLAPVCVEGSVAGVVNVETHGVYIEGTGCVKPRGGH
ncbi:hypothetical protein [Streptomyces sp. NPDC016845]|uniref:hypothetical protein n=1 Tax=Streptomyces sp. NPDC016845 TaxID=3364972 RepID=UPI0037BB6075